MVLRVWYTSFHYMQVTLKLVVSYIRYVYTLMCNTRVTSTFIIIHFFYVWLDMYMLHYTFPGDTLQPCKKMWVQWVTLPFLVCNRYWSMLKHKTIWSEKLDLPYYVYVTVYTFLNCGLLCINITTQKNIIKSVECSSYIIGGVICFLWCCSCTIPCVR